MCIDWSCENNLQHDAKLKLQFMKTSLYNVITMRKIIRFKVSYIMTENNNTTNVVYFY